MSHSADFEEGLVDLFRRRLEQDPDRIFARYEGEPISFADLDRRSDALARALAADGLKRGSHIAIMMENSPAVLALLFAIAKLGAVWVPVNVRARGESLDHILTHSEPDLLVTEDGLDPDTAVPRRLTATQLSELADGPPGFDAETPEPDDLYALMYTSGTTGKPKGVMVSHRMLRLSGEAIARCASADDGDIFHMWEPLYHIGGAQMIVLPLIRDTQLAMVDGFSASRFWQQVRDYGATRIHFLGGILQILLKQPESPLDRGHGARIAFGGGCPRDVWEPFQERFGIEIREGYGMTEASSLTSFNQGGPVGSIGRPLPWFQVTIEDDGGREVAQGARGEIVVRSPIQGALTAGYYKNTEATDKALKNGALHTGDIGSTDADGFLYFHGRGTDNVRVRGENVSAWEVEHPTSSHPAVEDCAMIGVAAEIGEQEIKLFVKPKAGHTLDPASLSAWLAERLAPYQLPRYIAVIDEFERTPSQRIMKHRLSPATDDAWDRMAAKA